MAVIFGVRAAGRVASIHVTVSGEVGKFEKGAGSIAGPRGQEHRPSGHGSQREGMALDASRCGAGC